MGLVPTKDDWRHLVVRVVPVVWGDGGGRGVLCAAVAKALTTANAEDLGQKGNLVPASDLHATQSRPGDKRRRRRKKGGRIQIANPL